MEELGLLDLTEKWSRKGYIFQFQHDPKQDCLAIVVSNRYGKHIGVWTGDMFGKGIIVADKILTGYEAQMP
jgi:hypothetical protein